MNNIRTSTPFNDVTPEQIATDIAREYLEIDHLNGMMTVARTREALKRALVAAYEAGARENPLRSFTPRELREFSSALYDLVEELDDDAEEDDEDSPTADLAALWNGILDELRGHILPREEGDAS